MYIPWWGLVLAVFFVMGLASNYEKKITILKDKIEGLENDIAEKEHQNDGDQDQV
jgi:hypothetical protein